jgi:hypothetical protein
MRKSDRKPEQKQTTLKTEVPDNRGISPPVQSEHSRVITQSLETSFHFNFTWFTGRQIPESELNQTISKVLSKNDHTAFCYRFDKGILGCIFFCKMTLINPSPIQKFVP